MPPPIIDWPHEVYSGRSLHPDERPSRPPWGGATVTQRHVRLRAIALMQANVTADRLLLVARHCPNPYDTTITKRDWESQCRAYRQRCRISVPALAFLEFGIAYDDEDEALFYLESLCSMENNAAIAPSFLESLD